MIASLYRDFMVLRASTVSGNTGHLGSVSARQPRSDSVNWNPSSIPIIAMTLRSTLRYSRYPVESCTLGSTSANNARTSALDICMPWDSSTPETASNMPVSQSISVP